MCTHRTGSGSRTPWAAVVAKVRTLVVVEDREIVGVVASLESPRRQELADEVIHAHRSASERPRPPRTTWWGGFSATPM